MPRFILHLKTGEAKLVEAPDMDAAMAQVGDKFMPEHDMEHIVVSVDNIDGPMFSAKLREKLLKQFQ